MKKFRPTQPAPLRRGELATKDDIFRDYIQRHDTGLEGFVRPQATTPAVAKAAVKRAPGSRNWVMANIHAAYP